MSIQGKFTKFNSAISITHSSDAYKEVREKDDSIKAALYGAFKEAGHPIKSDFRQGSFATFTAIYSLSGDVDLDRGLIVSEDDAPEDPVECKGVVLSVLENRGFKNAKIKKPCVTADYASLALHIDYPLYRESQFGELSLGVGKKNSKETERYWEVGESKKLIDWVNGKDRFDISSDQRDQYRRVIRYLKRWRDVCFKNEDTRKKIYSIALSVMTIECFRSSFSDGKPDDLDSILKTVNEILSHSYFHARSWGNDKYDVVVALPVAPYRDIFSKNGTTVGTLFRSKLKKLERKLQLAKDENDLKKQCEIIRTVFGDDFPEDDGGGDGVKKAVHLSAGSVPDHGGA